MLHVHALTKTFAAAHGDVHALKDVTFTVNTGEFASIIGKSGSGKTTLLSLLGALDTPSGGEIIVDDIDIAKLSGHDQTKYRARKIGFVFQHYNLIPNLTALENVMLALEFGGVPAHLRMERAAKLLEDVGLTNEEQR
jgi:putative ABC transport system ATP-binding protein